MTLVTLHTPPEISQKTIALMPDKSAENTCAPLNIDVYCAQQTIRLQLLV
jgi:hypothetical protein